MSPKVLARSLFRFEAKFLNNEALSMTKALAQKSLISLKLIYQRIIKILLETDKTIKQIDQK
ncbi:hypothetical protein KBC31_00225 [Candidatus Saccharibacteria bacterium]|jgi:hypothetical protein|nr:hypothetical protein [Candidatus Saccharibacteria bacterium]